MSGGAVADAQSLAWARSAVAVAVARGRQEQSTSGGGAASKRQSGCVGCGGAAVLIWEEEGVSTANEWGLQRIKVKLSARARKP